jgi:phenylpropionate dioxygenase-like ring-hydroxylating dioxygenase large terminal subunit
MVAGLVPPDTLLSDGTSFGELVDSRDHTVSMRVFSDPEIYRLELERLFARAWVPLAHVTEVPSPGDYVSRSIGQDPVVVVRDDDGQVQVLLNVCAHRGMQVCRSELGNARTFRCPYHGWIYGLRGDLRGVPAEREIYGDRLDKNQFGLRKARVAVFAGMVFATWDDEAPSIEDYLGDYGWYLQAAFNRSDSGMEVVGPPQRWIIPANWKYAADQFACDAYHVMTLHRSAMDLGLMGSIEDMRQVLDGIDVSSRLGHGLRCMPTAWYSTVGAMNPADDGAPLTTLEKLKLLVPGGMSPDMAGQVLRNLTPEQAGLVANSPPIVGQVFPTAAWLNGPALGGDLTPGAGISWRVWVPRGPGKMEVMYWALVEKDAPQAVKDATRKVTIQVFTDSGLIDQDDAEVWAGTQRVIGGAMAQRRRANYQGLLGISKPADWPGGGEVYAGPSSDDNQWNFWMRYLDFMTGQPWTAA